MKIKIIAALFLMFCLGAKAQDFTYSTNLYGAISTPLLIFAGTNSTDTARDTYIEIWNKINADTTLFWDSHLADASAISSNAAITPLATNSYPFQVHNTLTTSVTMNTPWTNVYPGRLTLTVDGTLTLAAASSTIIVLTNLTTSESHIIAGSSAPAGTEYFSYPYEIGTNEVVIFTNIITGTASAAITGSSGKGK